GPSCRRCCTSLPGAIFKLRTLSKFIRGSGAPDHYVDRKFWAFLIALGLTVAWIVSGLIFSFSDTWPLVMNTISSIVTFLMVFLLQRSQNKDAQAMQLKPNKIIAAIRGASSRLINVEDLSEDEVRPLHDRYNALTRKAQKTGTITGPLSIEQTN